MIKLIRKLKKRLVIHNIANLATKDNQTEDDKELLKRLNDYLMEMEFEEIRYAEEGPKQNIFSWK